MNVRTVSSDLAVHIAARKQGLKALTYLVSGGSDLPVCISPPPPSSLPY